MHEIGTRKRISSSVRQCKVISHWKSGRDPPTPPGGSLDSHGAHASNVSFVSTPEPWRVAGPMSRARVARAVSRESSNGPPVPSLSSAIAESSRPLPPLSLLAPSCLVGLVVVATALPCPRAPLPAQLQGSSELSVPERPRSARARGGKPAALPVTDGVGFPTFFSFDAPQGKANHCK